MGPKTRGRLPRPWSWGQVNPFSSPRPGLRIARPLYQGQAASDPPPSTGPENSTRATIRSRAGLASREAGMHAVVGARVMEVACTSTPSHEPFHPPTFPNSLGAVLTP
eukprot:scaffold22912_cov56-Isochrysis_galbana.AAC.1